MEERQWNSVKPSLIRVIKNQLERQTGNKIGPAVDGGILDILQFWPMVIKINKVHFNIK